MEEPGCYGAGSHCRPKGHSEEQDSEGGGRRPSMFLLHMMFVQKDKTGTCVLRSTFPAAIPVPSGPDKPRSPAAII